MKSWLADYCRSQEGLFVIPIEAQTPAGIAPSFQKELAGITGIDSSWFSQFNRAFSLYWKRADALHSDSPRYWFPPRLQHVAIITHPDQVRPYFQPFHRNSWLLYQNDFDPAYSTVEFAAFQFFQAERAGLLGQIVPALHANLPYFLTLDNQQRRVFSDGCKRTDRPDAAAWQALGKAQSWLKSLFHEVLRPPKIAVQGLRIHRENGLIVPPARAHQLATLQETWGEVAQGVLKDHHQRPRSASRHDPKDLLAWLSKNRLRVLVTSDQGKVLWDPDQPEHIESLAGALTSLTPSGDQRIRADLEVIDLHSRRFLSALEEPDSLVKPAPYMTEGGLCYIHGDRRLIAYDIGAGENENRLWEASPPFERWMLGARTIHEWGHLAAESGWVHIPAEKKAERHALTERLAALFDEVLESAPSAVRKLTAGQRASLAASHGSIGKGLLAAMLKRIEDYMANLVARRFLSADEMDTYVRNNVASRVTEYRPDQVYMQLIRLVYEYQYLALSRIENPRKWFFESTWIQPLLVDRGVIGRSQLEEIIENVGAICGCYEVATEKFSFDRPATESGSG